MPNWNQVLIELQANSKGPHDLLRLKYLKKLHRHTGRNVLAYYSGWLQKPALRGNPNVDMTISDSDKTGFMTCSHGVDRSKGLDLLLHTPGGDVAATESLIDYLQSLYKGDIRAIVPQIAMSGGTLIALSCKQIVMGRQSSIGPVDPQVNGWPAQGLIEEFELAKAEVANDVRVAEVWRPILSRYWPTLLTSSRHAIDWSDQLLRSCLEGCMLKGIDAEEQKKRIDSIANELGKQATSKNHARHISREDAVRMGVEVLELESDQELQDIVLTLHHSLTHTFSQTPAVKIIENHLGTCYVTQVQQVIQAK